MAAPYVARFLLSFPFFPEYDLESFRAFHHGYDVDVMLDSGAFGMYRTGKQVDIAAYARWVAKWPGVRFANLDVIGDADATYANQQRLLDLGVRPFPAFHVGEPYSALERYLDEGYTFIGLGGLVPLARRPAKALPFIARCFEIAAGRAVFHGFGATNWRLMSGGPWYSADSSALSYALRQRTVVIWDAKRKKTASFTRGNAHDTYRHARSLRKLGEDPRFYADSLQLKNDQRDDIVQAALKTVWQSEQRLRYIFGDVYVPGEQSDPGMKVYAVNAYAVRVTRIPELEGVAS